MEKKYLELKAKALERMAADFLWVINREYTERLQWTADTNLLVEFVHDVSGYLHPQDELFRRIPLYRLYPTSVVPWASRYPSSLPCR